MSKIDLHPPPRTEPDKNRENGHLFHNNCTTLIGTCLLEGMIVISTIDLIHPRK